MRFPSLTSPIQIGRLNLNHRVIMAPLTRNRATDDHIPQDMSREYYEQRAEIPGTLLISEGTFPSARAGGVVNVPGIYNKAQIDKWKAITDAVHARGSYIYCQLWAPGRAADPEVLKNDGIGHEVVSSSNLPKSDDSPIPRSLSEDEIPSWIEDYATAAKNSIEAGFDGVEIHGANGYLIDQFLQDNSNKRTDRWGGSIENRSRFGIEVAKAVSNAIGPDRTGYRISPWSTFQGMRMESPLLEQQFTHLVENLGRLNLAYLHIVEPRIAGSDTVGAASEAHQDHEFLLKAFGRDRVTVLAGGFNAESAEEAIKENKPYNVAIAFGRSFLANPDLPLRLARGTELNEHDRETFYKPKAPEGYIDYPFSEVFKKGDTSLDG